MRITRLHAEGFRSLRDVTLADLGPFNVFYGQNGVGKSNLVAALARACELVGLCAYGPVQDPRALGALTERDFRHGESLLRLALRVEAQDRPVLRLDPWDFVWVEVEVEATAGELLRARCSRLCLGMSTGTALELGEVLTATDLPGAWTAELRRVGIEAGAPDLARAIENIRRFLREVLGRQLFRLVPAVRELGAHQALEAAAGQGASETVAALLASGRLAQALARAATSPSPRVRQRLAQLQSLMSGPPLLRPPLAPVFDPEQNTYDLQEVVAGPDGEARAFSIGEQGLGVQQLYVVLGTLLLGSTSAVGLEEPEAHLHAPTTGRDLRALLTRVVDEGMITQLFVATHSNLFDLDLTGYWDVSMVEGETRVERRPLSDIDARHLYEPGPARHALLQLLRYAPPTEIVFRRPDGSPVTVAELQRSLQEDDALALAFLRTLHGAALRVVRLDARDPGTTA